MLRGFGKHGCEPFVTDDIFPNTYDRLAAAWRAVRRSSGLRVREVACVGAARTLLLAELGDAHQPVVSISAGVHGDEPGGAWALLSIVRDGLLDPRFAYRIWPCTNPTGFDAGTRVSADGKDVNRTFGRTGDSPEAKAILTANRDRSFALAIDLHEDPEADGFYLYETLAPAGASRYARPLTAALVEAGFSLQPFTPGFELGPAGSEAAQTLEPGAVIVDAEREAPFFGHALPAGIVMSRRSAEGALTFETPRRRPPEQRVAMHRIALVEALRELARKPERYARTR
jgi:predicted deacylase